MSKGNKQSNGTPPKYIDIVVKDNVTNEIYEFEDSAKFAVFFGLKAPTISIEKGYYKNFTISAKLNPKFKRKNLPSQIIEAENIKKIINADNDVVNEQPNKEINLKRCFEALSVIEYGTEHFEFKKIENFIDWLYNNKFLIDQLKD